MRLIHGFFLAGLAPVLVNCSTHPLVEDVTRTTTFDIVRKIRCEAKRAVLDYDLMATNLSANTISAIAYEFTFDNTETNNAAGDVTWNIPFLNGGSFTLVANADSTRMRESNRNFKIVDTFDELRKTRCSQEALEKDLIYPIAGDIGVYEVVTTFAKLQRVARLDPRPNPPVEPITPPFALVDGAVFRFADTLEFTTTFSPNFSLSST
jgi:hypothetical protein